MRGAVADVLDQRESCEQTLSTPKRSFPSSADMSTLTLNSRDVWKRAPERVPEDGAGGCGSERAVGRLPGEERGQEAIWSVELITRDTGASWERELERHKGFQTKSPP